MQSPLRRSLSTALLGFALGCTLPAFAGDPQWVEVRSPHFSVMTDAGEKRGRDVAVRFEQMRAVFGALLVKANVNLPVPLQIIAFRSTKELRQFAPLWKGKPTQVAGLFQGGNDRSFILLDLSSENPWQVVFHEYAHQLLDGNVTPRADPWFEEGFAEYFSSIEVDGKEARVGKIPEDTYLVIRQTGLMKLADLFRVQQYSSTYNESGDRRSAFYAESSFVVHYLYENGLIPKLARYFELFDDKKVPVEDAIQQAFGMSAAQFDKVLRDYIGAGRFKYFPLATPAGIVTSNYAVVPLGPSDSGAALADAHLHSPDYRDKAVEEFQAILKTVPNHSAALRGLGYAHLEKLEYDEASKYFERAAAGDSKDPRVHYYAALLISREKGMGEAELPRMIKELETSIALDPNYADAYEMLGFAYAYSGKSAQGLEMMKKALSLNPRNESYVYNLGQLYLNDREPDEAIAVLQTLRGAQNPQVAAQSVDLLRHAEELKAALRTGGGAPSGLIVRAQPARPDDPQAQGEEAARKDAAMARVPAMSPTRFLKGSLVSVDCSQAPGATVNLQSGARKWALHVADTRHVIVIGVDAFSCAWPAGSKVAVNYRESAPGQGEVVSLELQ